MQSCISLNGSALVAKNGVILLNKRIWMTGMLQIRQQTMSKTIFPVGLYYKTIHFSRHPEIAGRKETKWFLISSVNIFLAIQKAISCYY
jgi:hypothetical protein